MKRKLLLAALCVVCALGFKANAQKDVTSQYITNATLSNGTTGWTVSNFNAPQRGNNTVGYASECWGGWSGANAATTSYSMKQTITLPEGRYRLVNYSFYRDGTKDNTSTTSHATLFAGTNTTSIASLKSIKATGYANTQAEGANVFDSKMYRNVVEFTIDADNTEIEIGVQGTHEIGDSWVIVGMFELFDLDDLASVSSPTDVTYAITNPGFEYRDLTGWTNTGLKYQNNNWANKSGIGFAEQWSADALGSNKSITQTLENMPAGLYELSVYGHNILQSESDAPKTGMFLKANSNQTEIGAYGQYKVRTTLASDGDLTIGINLDNCTGNWIAFDRFELKFFGDPTKAYQALLDEVVEKAQTLVDGNTIPDAAESALQTVINNNDNDDHAFTEESQFNTAMDNINDAYDTYKALEAKYAIWLEVKAGATAMKDVENNNATATSTLNTAIGTQNTAAEGATTNDGLNTAIAALRSAILAFAKDAVPTSGNRFDLTCLLTNHDLTGLSTWAKADGWYTEQSGGNSQVMNGSNKYFYEYWSDQTTPATSGYTVYLKTTLPKGVYSMSAQAFATDQRNDAAKEENPTVDGISFSANEVDGTSITHEGTDLAAASISFYQASESEVKLGLKAHIGNTRNWMGIGYVQLYKEANDQAAGVYATVRTSANNALNSAEYTNVTGKERSDLATLAAVETPADYVEAIEALQEANSTFVSAKATYDTWATSTITKNTTNVGTGVFQLDETRNNSLYSAYETARNHEITSSTVASDVAEWNTAVATAISNYTYQALNAPDVDKRYVLTIVEDGKDWNGNAVTFIAGGRNDMGGYGIQYLAPANANLNQALKFTAVAGEANTYKVSAINVADGAERYITTGSIYSGNNSQIRTTDDASKASWIKIQATTTNGQFQLLNVSDGNKVIANNNNKDMYTANSANFTIAEASEASVDVTIDADVQYATRIFPFKPTLPSGVKAYSCEELDGNKLTLVEVAEPQANVPYILVAENGYTGEALTGWGIAGKTTYTQGLLTGVYESTTAAAGTYVLQKNNGKVAFYLVETDQEPTIGANRAYLTDGSGNAKARAYFFDGDASAIEAISALTAGEVETIYNAAGVQVKSLQKGMNIVVLKNGQTQKVYVK